MTSTPIPPVDKTGRSITSGILKRMPDVLGIKKSTTRTRAHQNPNIIIPPKNPSTAAMAKLTKYAAT
jgi:hypothetical protein